MKTFKEYVEENQELCFEMANISKKNRKELPANIFISTKRGSHGCRIKVQNNYDGSLQEDKFFVISVPDGKITGDTGKIKESDINYFKRFVKENEKILKDHWFKNIDSFEAIGQLKFNV